MSRSFPKDLKMSSQENSGFYNGTNFVGIHCKMHKQDVTDNECTDSNVFVKCERSEQLFEFGGKWDFFGWEFRGSGALENVNFVENQTWKM